ncbi:hypothetical protein G4B88_028675 [Cannabis sativa]|uniref:Polygalacturonase n=1 Tax=Cannabis sativa TaxID=3483 RepID=A0A7J6END7_CANSA|nr:hypothetical protein G4B88_028675 [Cannabis sativa]
MKNIMQAFMKTWVAACHFKGRARVLIPPGVYALGPLIFAGPCIGPSPIIVQVSGTLKGDTDISLYEEPAWFQFENIDGLIVTGGGAFDGQGESAWKYNDCKNNNDCVQLPSNIKLNKVSNAILRGFTSADSKGVHIFITNSQNIRLKRLHIVAPGDSPNTDGVHISTSINVKVSKTIIATGDDCIDNGIRIKTWPGSTPSLATGMIFQDLVMDNVRNPIIIDQGYCPSGCKKQPSRVKISNIQYINIRGTSSSEVGVNLMCSPQYQCENIHLFNINLKHIGNGPITATCANARVSTFGGLQSPRVTCHN